MPSSFFKHAMAAVVALAALPAAAQMTEQAPFSVRTAPGIVYARGEIRENGEVTTRDLWMDAYFPEGEQDRALPAVIYTHGGSFHIGSPRTAYRVAGAQTTSPADYCRLFAGLGYACFAINYRLGPEEPVASGIGYDEADVDRQSIALMMDRVSVIRQSLDLRALDEADENDQKLLSDTVLSAAEDLWRALHYVRDNAQTLNIDRDRIVLGGFSAGAVTSLNVAHGMNAPVAGVFMLSTAPIGLDIARTVTSNSSSAPALFFVGQHDLSGALASVEGMISHFQEVGLDFRFAWVPAFGHFYPSGATSLGAKGSQLSVEERIVKFVQRVTR